MQNCSTEIQHRTLGLELEKRFLDTEKRTVSATVSSENPVDRMGYVEVLDHTTSAIDLTRAKDGLSLLLHHDSTRPIGIAEGFKISSGKLRCNLRFGTSPEAASAWADVQSGVLRFLSIGYQVENTKYGSDNVVHVTRWAPYEVSLVSIPADPSVGIGRSLSTQGTKIMETNNTSTAAEMSAERSRIAAIMALGRQHNLAPLAESAIREGLPLDEFRAAVLTNIVGKQEPMGISWADVSGRERNAVAEFSLSRAVSAAITGDWSNAGAEREISQEIARRSGRAAGGMFVPSSALVKRSTMVAASNSIVGTEHMPEEFITSLVNTSQVLALGATRLSGLNQSASIPRQTGNVSASWMAEDSTITESNATFDAVTLTPKQVSGRVAYSKKLLVQGLPSIEDLMRADLSRQIGLAIDLAAINGSGSSNQPLGILNVSGIGSVAGGTNGAAPTYAHMIALETALANANADNGSLGYLTNSKVRGKLKNTEKASSTGMFVWEAGATFDRVNGYKAAVSNQMPSNLTKGSASGVCSAIIFGNWQDLLIGEFGAVDLLVDPYSDSAKANVRIVATAFVDVAVRHAESFAAMTDALTA